MIETWHEDDASTQLVSEIARTRGSVTFETNGEPQSGLTANENTF